MSADTKALIGRCYETIVDLPQAPKGTFGQVVEADPAKGVCVEWMPAMRAGKAAPDAYRFWFTEAELAQSALERRHDWWSQVARKIVGVVEFADFTTGLQALAALSLKFGDVKLIELVRPHGPAAPTAAIRLYDAELQMLQLTGFAPANQIAWGEPEGTPGIQHLAQLFAQLQWPYSEEQIATWQADHYILWRTKLMFCENRHCVRLPEIAVDRKLLGARDILVFRGRQYWPTPEDVIREVHRMGLSVRIPRFSIPEGMVRGVSRIGLAHTRATMYVHGEPVRKRSHAALLDTLRTRFAALQDKRVDRLLEHPFEHWPSQWLAMPEDLADPIFHELGITWGQGIFGYSYWTGTTYYLKEGETQVPTDLAERGVGGARALHVDDEESVEIMGTDDVELTDEPL